MIHEEKLIQITKILLDIMFYSGILVIVTLPLTLKYAGAHYSAAFQEYYILMLIIFALAGICGIIIVGQLRKMMRTVAQKNCFVYENVKSLKVMGIASAVIVLLFFIKCFFLPTPATFIIVLTFFIAGLFSEVLSFVFGEAIRYKEENDLTI